MKVILIVLLTLQLVAIIQGQNGDGPGGLPSNSGDNNSIQPTSSNPNPSSADPNASASQTNNPSASATPSNSAQSSDQQQPSSSTVINTPTASTSQSDHSRTQDNSSHRQSSTNTATMGPTASSAPSNASTSGGDGSATDNVGKIAGGVVGGVVGLALIGGLLTWLNRRGGCTSRTKRRHHDNIDDFALHTNDKAGDNASPFQRRMAPLATPSATSYMNMSNDDMNRDRVAGYPSSHVPDSQYGYSDAQIHSPFDTGSSDPWLQQDNQEYYNPFSLQSPNAPDLRVKPDTVDYKPHQV